MRVYLSTPKVWTWICAYRKSFWKTRAYRPYNYDVNVIEILEFSHVQFYRIIYHGWSLVRQSFRRLRRTVIKTERPTTVWTGYLVPNWTLTVYSNVICTRKTVISFLTNPKVLCAFLSTRFRFALPVVKVTTITWLPLEKRCSVCHVIKMKTVQRASDVNCSGTYLFIF